MRITKKSVNLALPGRSYYRHYITRGYNGIIPSDSYGMLNFVAADLREDGSVRITNYVNGDAMEPDHYNRRCADVTDIITEWISDSDISRESVITAIQDAMQSYYGDESDDPQQQPSLVSVAEYAKLHGKAAVSVRQRIQRGGFKTAQKIGSYWVIDRNEPYDDQRVKSGDYKNWRS